MAQPVEGIMAEDAGIVQAEFTPGGKRYTYFCPGARIGDIITGPGATGPAKVVAYGRTSYTGPLKQATIINQEANNMPVQHPIVNMNDYPTIRSDQTPAEYFEEQAAIERKRERQARKLAKQQKRDLAARNATRQLAVDALARVAAQEEDHGAAVAAAIELLKVTK